MDVHIISPESQSPILYSTGLQTSRLFAAALVLFTGLSLSLPLRLSHTVPRDISIKLLFGSEANSDALELVMDFATVNASDNVLIVPSEYSWSCFINNSCICYSHCPNCNNVWITKLQRKEKKNYSIFVCLLYFYKVNSNVITFQTL